MEPDTIQPVPPIMDAQPPMPLPVDDQATAVPTPTPMVDAMAPETGMSSPAATPEAGTVHTILIVEDDKVLQELYYDRFTAAGLTVVQAFDGLQALDRMESHPEVQLVLLDLMLPKMSGYDVLAQLKRSADKRDIPVIIVSALTDVDDQARGLQLGAAEYITKGEMLPGVVIEKIKAYVLSVPGTAAN